MLTLLLLADTTVAVQAMDLDPLVIIKNIFTAVSSGNWVSVVALVPILIVGLLRRYGRKLHELIPDDSPLDKPLWFVFDTKPGGWLLNAATSISLGLFSAAMSGVPITWALLQPILAVTLSGAAIWGLLKDLWEWYSLRKKATEAVTAEIKAVEAGKSATNNPPGSGVNQ